MQTKQTIFPIFGILLIILLIFIALSFAGVLSQAFFINSTFAPLQKFILGGTRGISSENSATQKLRDENNNLRRKLVTYKNTQAENNALRDQFATVNPSPEKLLPARIVGEPGFFPNMTAIESMVIDKGFDDGVKQGSVVVYKDNLIGRVAKTTNSFAQVILVSNTATTFTAKTLDSQALGIIKGQGQGQILLDNVVIDQKLSLGETIITNGDTNVNGQGFQPNLIVGKITGIEKNPSALFQKANVKSLIDISKLDIVFVILQK